MPLADKQYDDVYTGLNRHGRSEAVYADPGTGVEIAVISDEAFKELVIYAPLDRDVVCLEPYTCVTDAFNLETQGIDAGDDCAWSPARAGLGRSSTRLGPFRREPAVDLRTPATWSLAGGKNGAA